MKKVFWLEYYLSSYDSKIKVKKISLGSTCPQSSIIKIKRENRSYRWLLFPLFLLYMNLKIKFYSLSLLK